MTESLTHNTPTLVGINKIPTKVSFLLLNSPLLLS